MHGRLKPSRDAGISLIEVLVAVLVLSIGVVAGFQSLGQARRGIGEEVPRLLARTAALNRAEELRILGAAAAGVLPPQVQLGGIVWSLETRLKPTEGGFVEATVRASAEGRPGAVQIAYVPAEPPS